jgi:hypothetical protein
MKYYPTPSSTTYYINEYIIDDMFRVDFNRQVKHQPIWGYDSTKYDFIAKGKEIVTGNLIINFRYPGYLRNVLTEHRARTDAVEGWLQRKNMADVNNIVKADQELGESLLETFDNTFHISEKNALVSNIMLGEREQSAARQSKELDQNILAIKKSLEERFFMSTHSTEEESPTGARLDSPMDGGEIINFDMSVRYGFQGVPGGFVRVFKDVVLLGEQETVSASVNMGGDMSSSAQPILEIYPFVCRTIEIKEYI